MKIVAAEPLAPAAVRLLEERGDWQIVISNPREYVAHLGDADALIIRGGVTVTAAVLAQAPRLKVIGKTGVGADNVDLDAATERGILVMNTPGGNAVSVAEHTLALMLSLARFIPQAGASLKAGRWEKRQFLGSELREKTLGIIGLGSIGREVVKRAKAFEMRILATDPYVNPQTAGDVGVQLVDLNTLYAQSDYITLHTALTPESVRMLGSDAFARMKRGVRIVNCARGELIDQSALQAALESGQVAGAALDVFEQEPPPPGDPLLAMDQLLATPHIGGATEEAQEIVGVRIAQQVADFLQEGLAVHAVNAPALTPEQYRNIGPLAGLAERLGAFASHVAQGNPRGVTIVYYGKVAEQSTQFIRNAGVAGVLNRSLARKANWVNAMQLAGDRGLSVAERHDRRSRHTDSVRLDVETETGTTSVEGAVFFDQPRLLQVDGASCEALLEGNLTFLKTRDVPGVIGYVGAVLGEFNINIATFSLGRTGSVPEAISIIATDQPVPDRVLRRLLENSAVAVACPVRFS